MNTICLALIILSSFWTGPFSLAKTETMSVKDVAVAIPQSLIAHGISRVGPLELQPLVDDITNKVKWAVVPVFSIGAGTNGALRSGSSCHLNDHTVLVNEPHLQNLKNIRLIRGLLLHEALCALGWDDDNYTISSTLGALEMISRSPSDLDVNKAHQILENQVFMIAFRSKLHTRTQEQHFSKPDQLMVAGGGVTGVGGGGDGFGWYLKTMLFQSFFAHYALCSEHPQENEIPYPKFDAKGNGYGLYLSCIEPRLFTWWNYLFSLTIETAYFKYSSPSGQFPNEMPWAGTFTVEEVAKPGSSLLSAQIQITIDSLRWMINEPNQWSQYSTGIFMTLLTHYYPKRNSELIKSHPIIEVRGNKEYVQSFQNTFKFAPIKKCLKPNPNPNFDMSLSYEGITLIDYLKRRLVLSEAELSNPPHCVYVID